MFSFDYFSFQSQTSCVSHVVQSLAFEKESTFEMLKLLLHPTNEISFSLAQSFLSGGKSLFTLC